MEQLLAQIPQLTLAQASLRCRTYTRALLHFELHLRKEINLDANRRYLFRLFAPFSANVC